ncbi:MAG TPA: helix-turn-helix domain-containing protein, partial [Bacteroidales bacterium]|nr:helix-turn-helix domain-containing protein [Bacteroidales bacterium]
MPPVIHRYPVKHPLLRKHIRFFWELRAEHMHLDHTLIPQRNINLRFNLCDTPHFIHDGDRVTRLESSYFPGLQDHFRHLHLRLDGRVEVLGVCFSPAGFYPFAGIPVSEFKNQVLGVREVGNGILHALSERLREADGTTARLHILESELEMLLVRNEAEPGNFTRLFSRLKTEDSDRQIAGFCRENRITPRTLERMYNKFVGLPAGTYGTLNRFHSSMNQLLHNDFSKLSDVAFDNGYFDQTHFIRDFRRYTGNTPKNFVK